jgi:capsular polysaccharide biosynthesis protein
VIGDLSSLKPAAAALIAGLILILAYLVLSARADQTVRDPRAIERRLGVPVVATIPKLAGSRGV